MANLTLVYGMRLLPSDEVSEVGQAPVKLTNGREAHVTMHVLEGSKEEIEKQLRTSLEASSISILRSERRCVEPPAGPARRYARREIEVRRRIILVL